MKTPVSRAELPFPKAFGYARSARKAPCVTILKKKEDQINVLTSFQSLGNATITKIKTKLRTV